MGLKGVFGPIFNAVTTRELMDAKQLANLKINIIKLNYSDELRKACAKLSYAEEIDLLVTNDKRNEFIKKLALSLSGNTLILFNLVAKHGKPLYKMINDGNDTNRKIFYVSGEVNAVTRETVRSTVEKESNAIIVASMATFSTGINIKNLHNIIFASPSKSQIRILQSIGRGLRISDDNRDTVVYDIADDLRWKSNSNYTLNHAIARIQLYNKSKFDYHIHEYNINC